MNTFQFPNEDGVSKENMNRYGDFNGNLDKNGLFEDNTYRPSLSPYLNFDPTYLPTQPEYIFPYGNKRGRFEYSFYYIGASCMAGAAIGGFRGFYNGLNLTTLAGQTGRVRRTRIFNHVMKQGAASANTLGCIALIYSGFGLILSSIFGVEDEPNCLSAATLTGALCRLPGGLHKCAVGGAFGLGLSSLYCLYTNRVKLFEFEEKFYSQYQTSTKETISDHYDESDKSYESD